MVPSTRNETRPCAFVSPLWTSEWAILCAAEPGTQRCFTWVSKAAVLVVGDRRTSAASHSRTPRSREMTGVFVSFCA